MTKNEKVFQLLPDVDALIVTSEDNRLYFTGFSGSFGVMVITKTETFYITDFRYFEMANEAMKDSGIIIKMCGNGLGAYEIAKAILLDMGAKTVAYEDTEITVEQARILQQKIDGFEWVEGGRAILNVRRIKDEKEIEYITKAQQITDKAFAKILNFIKQDITEHEVCVELEYQMRKFGADGIAFDTIIASGANSSKPHAHPTQKQIKNGDAITMDFGAKYHGYCSDMTRTVFLGKPNEEMRKIYKIVHTAQCDTINNMKCYMTGKEVDAIARNVIVSNGYPEHFNHGLGHSLGICVHEAPSCNYLSQEKLEPNMLMTVEPGIYVPNFGGVRIEDMVVVKEDKIINLTTATKEFIIL